MREEKRGQNKCDQSLMLNRSPDEELLVLHVNLSNVCKESTICQKLSHNICPVHFIDG